MNERTNEHMNGRTDKRKSENYIPVGINARGIKSSENMIFKEVLDFDL